MDKVTVYMVLDIVFTPLFDQSTNQIMDLNNSKSIWVKADLNVVDGRVQFPTFATSVFCPFAISEEGVVLKCSYDPRLVGIQCYAMELDILKQGVAMDGNEWDWQQLGEKRRAFHMIHQVYKGFERFKQCYSQYPRDNSLLKVLIKDAELEL